MILSVTDEMRHQVIELVGWALVHATYQGFVLALLAWALMRVARQWTQMRYLIGCICLLLMLLLPCATSWWTQHQWSLSEPLTITESRSLPDQSNASSVTVDSARIAERVQTVPDQQQNVFLPPDLDPMPSTPGWMMRMVVGWFIGAGGFAAYLGLGLLGCRQLKCTGVQPVPEEWFARIKRLAHRVGLRRPPRVLVSIRAHGPLVIGWLRPCILLPSALLLQMTPAQVEMILLHEMAHLRRFDLWVNLLQTFIETLLFFHPAMWWLSRRIRTERELCCDELVLEITEARDDYAQTLWSIAASGHGSLAIGAIDGELRRRIEHILLRDFEEFELQTPQAQVKFAAGVGRRPRLLRPRSMHWLGFATVLITLLMLLWVQFGSSISAFYLKQRLSQLIRSPNPSPDSAVVLGWNTGWRSVDWSESRTQAAAFVAGKSGATVSIIGRDVQHVWIRDLHEPIDLSQYPVVVMQYRMPEESDTAGHEGYVLWADDGTGPATGGQALVTYRDFICDGRSHTLIKDLRGLALKGPLIRLALRAHGSHPGMTQLEISDVRFLRPPGVPKPVQASIPNLTRQIHVMDSSGVPLYGATLWTSIERCNSAVAHRTDARGTVSISMPSSPFVWLYVESPDYAATEVGPLKADDPTELIVTLDRASTVGGVVVDDAGRPLADATVELILAGATLRAAQATLKHVQVVTDAQGRWRTEPLALQGNTLYATVSQQNYVPCTAVTRPQAAAATHDTREQGLQNGPSMQSYLQGDAKFILTPGLALTGQILGLGRSATGIDVQLETRDGVPLSPRRAIAADGSFTLANVSPGEAILVLRGHGPMLSGPVTLGGNEKRILIQADDLKQHNAVLKLTGSVTDHQTGKALPAFKITLAHVHRTDSRGTPGETHIELPTTKTFTDGVFATEGVSSGLPTILKIEAEGYESILSRPYLKHEGPQVWNASLMSTASSP